MVVRVHGEDLSFFEECLVRYLDRRGVPRTCTLAERAELLITNDHVHSSSNLKLYSLHDSWNFTEQRQAMRYFLQ